MSRRVTALLRSAHPALFTAYAALAAFATYFCMYAFRKPFSAAEFAGTVDMSWTGLAWLAEPLGLKTLFVISQVAGYAASKFLGIKVVSELTPTRRAVAILVVIGVAEAALVLFGVIPAPWNFVALILNGLPLGMVWGLVFGFVEGRKTSDLIGAALCVSFIVASGVVKSVGLSLIQDFGVSEYWMPALTGLIFAVPLGLSVWMLSLIPQPSAEDQVAREAREPMDGPARRAFFLRFAPGLSALVAGYVLLTVARTLRDDFASNIWDDLGFPEPAIMTVSEFPVALGATLAVALIFAFRDNRRALLAIHGLLLLGGALMGLSTLGYVMGWLPPAWWMIGVGLGMYIAYVPVNSVLFDRLIGAVGVAATAGFLIYVADAFGYLAYVGLLLYRNFGDLAGVSWADFFVRFCWVTTAGTLVLFAGSAVYFARVSQPASRSA